MGACTSKTKKNKDKYLQHETTGNNGKKNSIADQQQAASIAEKFANVPFIDSEEKLTTNNTPPPPTATTTTTTATTTTNAQSVPPTNDSDERTTVKTNFETNISYSSAETIDNLKQEVYTFLREKILPIPNEKQKLLDYVHKRLASGGGASSNIASTTIDESLEQCLSAVEQQRQQLPSEINDKMKKRLMNIVAVYVASQSAENSFLKALYDKMGSLLDLDSLNAETSEHEIVNVTVTKSVRQIFVDGSSKIIPNNISHVLPTTKSSTNEQTIPADLPDDIRRKAEQVLNSFQ